MTIFFIPARVTDNTFCNPEYRQVLEKLTGWERRAWLDGDWDIAAGQYFTNFRRHIHVIPDFDDTRGREWFAAMDYGYAHYTVVLLGFAATDFVITMTLSATFPDIRIPSAPEALIWVI